MQANAHAVDSGAVEGDLFPLGEVIQLLSQCHRRLRRLLAERLSRWELNDTEFLVLWLCRQSADHGLAQHDLAETLGVSPPHVSGLVERLRERGLLTGRRCRLDRRRQLWFLDEAAQQLLQEIRSELEQLAGALDQHLAVPQRQTLISLLRNLSLVGTGTDLRLFDPDEQEETSGMEASDARVSHRGN